LIARTIHILGQRSGQAFVKVNCAAIPTGLLEQRPDVAAGERRVAEANEQIGIARAAFFPTIVLSASAGLEGDSITDWFAWPSRFWAVGPDGARDII
jgi:outer membrane protein TolC